MNRADRRKWAKAYRELEGIQKRNPQAKVIGRQEEATPDFSDVTNEKLCQGIVYILNELRSRGYRVYDFDHKERSLQQIQIMGENIYFLAAPEEEQDGEKETD